MTATHHFFKFFIVWSDYCGMTIISKIFIFWINEDKFISVFGRLYHRWDRSQYSFSIVGKDDSVNFGYKILKLRNKFLFANGSKILFEIESYQLLISSHNT